jgi:hypothetical protein
MAPLKNPINFKYHLFFISSSIATLDLGPNDMLCDYNLLFLLVLAQVQGLLSLLFPKMWMQLPQKLMTLWFLTLCRL